MKELKIPNGVISKLIKAGNDTETYRGLDSTVILKVFNPYGLGTWLFISGDELGDGDILLYGYCHIYEWEWGCVSLRELQGVKVNVFGYDLPLERERYLTGKETVRELVNI